MNEDQSYTDRAVKQSQEWAFGRPYHNQIDDECVPDFSCCIPDLFTKDKEMREARHYRLLRDTRRLS